MKWISIKNNIIYSTVLILIIILLEIGSYIFMNIHEEKITSKVDRFNLSEEQDRFNSELENFRQYKYKAFVEWVASKKDGKYINIDSFGRRKSVGENRYSSTIGLFGGSTMWGYGVSDENTIPSLIALKTKSQVVNYAEQAYNSRQNLNLLLNNIEKFRNGDLIVFYDGVNDIYGNCLNENSGDGHLREGYIRDNLQNKNNNFFVHINWRNLYYKSISVSHTANLIYKMQGIDLKKINKSENDKQTRTYVCNNEERSEAVAAFLVNNWRMTERFLNGSGINFVCILQPNPYTLKTGVHYTDPIWKMAVLDVYPKIIKKAKDLNCFEDGREWVKNDHYIDGCCHLNSDGNAEIANQLHEVVRKKMNPANFKRKNKGY